MLLVTVKENANWKKVSLIPPFLHNNKYVTDIKEKSRIFNSFFIIQCSLISNSSILPSELTLLTEHTLTYCDFSKTDILQIINNQNSNKAHGHDMISICMLKLCHEAICRLLIITGKFDAVSMQDVVTVDKKDEMQNIKNYRPVLLLSLCVEIFERLIYNVMYDFLSDNNLLFETFLLIMKFEMHLIKDLKFVGYF